MGKSRDRMVYLNKDGKWVDKRNDATRGRHHDTQQEAIEAARITLGNQGGGELTVKGRNQKIRSKDTIHPGKDPMPPQDTEH